jgi:16S rRNA (uracil1498-N3)-methyltransferase
MHIFYIPRIQGDRIGLEEQESKHAIRVLRLTRGDRVTLVDGRGGWYEAVITGDHPKHCMLQIESAMQNFQPLAYYLHLAVAPTKNIERFEWFLEKATEIGISEITPLICHRSERKQVNYERLEKILVSAMKQSMKAYLPKLNPSVGLRDFLQSGKNGTLGIAHGHSKERRSIHELSHTGSYTLLVGPEGDFTGDELTEASGAGYIPFHLGSSRLRTETAALYITAAIALHHL